MSADSSPIRCPNCRLLNPPAAQACDCGYQFATGRVVKHGRAAFLSGSSRPSGSRGRSILAGASLVALTSGGVVLASFNNIHTQGGVILAGLILGATGVLGALVWCGWLAVGALERLKQWMTRG